MLAVTNDVWDPWEDQITLLLAIKDGINNYGIWVEQPNREPDS